MRRLFETIKCLDGKCFHLDYHQKRLDLARKALGFTDTIEIKLNPPTKGLFRCRLLYEKKIDTIEFLPYALKKYQSFKLIHSQLCYDLKYEDRTELNTLISQKNEADDIIIIKDNLVTDTSIANLCFFDGEQWLTPTKPLLKGTTRQRLLDEKKIFEADIPFQEIQKFSKIAIMNAMIGFQIIENAIIL